MKFLLAGVLLSTSPGEEVGFPDTPKGKDILLCVISFPYGKTHGNEGGADGCDLPRKRARPN